MKRHLTPIIFLISLAGVIFESAGCSYSYREKNLSPEYFVKREDRSLISVITRDHQVREPASFWLEAINDDSLAPAFRRHCLIEFFRRHVPIGMKLSELVAFPGVTNWYSHGEIGDFGFYTGPRLFEREDPSRYSLVSLRANFQMPATDSAVVLRLSALVSEEQFIAIMTGKSPAPKGVRILDIGLYEEF